MYAFRRSVWNVIFGRGEVASERLGWGFGDGEGKEGEGVEGERCGEVVICDTKERG